MSDQPDQRPLPDNTHHSQEMDYHVTSRIWTHNPSKQAATDLRLSPISHWDRPSWNNSRRKCVTVWNNNFIELYYTGVNNVWYKSLFLYFPYCSFFNRWLAVCETSGKIPFSFSDKSAFMPYGHLKCHFSWELASRYCQRHAEFDTGRFFLQ